MKPHYHCAVVTVPPADDLVMSFHLNLDRSVARHSGLRPRYDVKLLSLMSDPTALRDKPNKYEMAFSLSFSGDENVYRVVLDAPFHREVGQAKTVERFGNILQTQFVKPLEERYPYLAHTPSFFLEDAGALYAAPVTGTASRFQFAIILPPFTALITDAVGFFETCGFGTQVTTAPEYYALKGNDFEEEVYGFWNKTLMTVKYVGEALGGQDEMDMIYTRRCPDEGLRTRTPSLEVRYFTDILQAELVVPQPLSRQHAVAAISTVLDDGLRLLSIDHDAISLVLEGDRMYLKSKQYESGTIAKKRKDEMRGIATVKIKFVDEEVRNYLQLDDDTMDFRLDDPRSVELRPIEDESFDALAEHYPVAVVCLSHGTFGHHLGNVGWVSLLGIVNSPCDVNSYELEVPGSLQYVVCRLLDKFHRPIKTEQPLTFHVGLQASLL